MDSGVQVDSSLAPTQQLLAELVATAILMTATNDSNSAGLIDPAADE